MRAFGGCLLALLVALLFAVPGLAQPVSTRLAPDLTVRPVAPGVYLHTTTVETEGFGTVVSHGLVVVDGGEALLVDTAWGEAPTAALLAWIDDTLGARTVRAVVTHGHADRMGGVPALRRSGIPAYGLAHTAHWALEQGQMPPDSALAGLHTLPVGGRSVEVFHPGPGHAPDNLVVWLPEAHLLFGGCLIRPAETRSLGNVGDAVVEEWARSVARVETRYPDAQVVVPSHGAPAGPELLVHTRRLVEAYLERPPTPPPGG